MGYNKKILSKAVSELGKAKAPAKPKDIKVDPNGYWNPDNHGKPVRIPGNNITMQGVQQPLYGVDNTGFAQMMYPGQDYQFQGDYVDEYPLTQAKKGGEKKYSRSLSATNKLFKKNPLVKAKKKKNKKTFDPNAKYYQTGGITTQEEIDAANDAMMKARFAYASTHGNPAAQRMVTAPDQPYMFDENTPGTHYMASMDNYAVPQIQNVNGQLMLDDFGPDSNEAIRFDSPEDAQFFSENYKKIAPDSSYREMDLTSQEIEEYRKGGYIVEYLDDPSIPELTKAQTGTQTSADYRDSLILYNWGRNLHDYNRKIGHVTYDADLPKHLRWSNSGAEKAYKNLALKKRAPNPKIIQYSKSFYGNGSDIPNYGYTGTAYFPKPLGNQQERKPTLEVGKLPIKSIDLPTPNIIPGNYNYTPKKPETIRTASRSQTIMEPDSKTPGKFKVKESRQVPYSAYFSGEGWEEMNAPKVMYYNPETGQETEERFNTWNTQEGLNFQDGGLVKAQSGKTTSCPDGQVWDDKLKECVLPGIREVEETVIYGDQEKRKLQGELMDKLKQVKGAYQDWRGEAGLRKARLNNEGASTIEGLKTQIADYKKQLEEEKKAYDKAGKALNVLKAKRPDEWKNAKLADVMSTKGIEALRTLYSEDKISDQTFRDFYNSFGSEYDPNVVKGTGANRQYSAKEAQGEWMENVPEFTSMVNKVAMAAPLVGAGLAIAPAVAPYGRALLPYADKAASAAGSFLRNRFVQGALLADTAVGIPDVVKNLDRAIATGENLGGALLDTGLTALELAFAKGQLKNVMNKAADLIKPAQEVLQTPLIKNAAIAKYFPNIGQTAINSFKSPLGKATAEAMADLTPGNLLTATGVGAGAATLPYVIEKGESTSEIINDPDIPWAQKYESIKDFGKDAVSSFLTLAPLTRYTRPIAATRAATAYSAPASLEKFIQGDLGSGLGMLTTGMKFINPQMAAPVNRVSSFTGKPFVQRTLFDSYKKGGNASNSYETILSQNQIKELEKQGYKIEYLD
jgi:hypothetical protein